MGKPYSKMHPPAEHSDQSYLHGGIPSGWQQACVTQFCASNREPKAGNKVAAAAHRRICHDVRLGARWERRWSSCLRLGAAKSAVSGACRGFPVTAQVFNKLL